MPDKPVAGETLDLREFHERFGRRYVFALMVFSMFSMLMLAHLANGFVPWLDSARYSIIATLITWIALRARSVRLDTAAAVGQAVLTTVYMVVRLQSLST